jgi:biopolymer transport protein ExbD
MRLKPPELRRARIEIVPMIDTIFFLLVFFMITSLSMVALRGKKVVLPESETAKGRPHRQVTLTVDHDRRFFVDREELPEGQILERLQEAVARDPDVDVVLNCDRELPASYFLRAFDLAKRADAAKVMVATMPRGLGVVR